MRTADEDTEATAALDDFRELGTVYLKELAMTYHVRPFLLLLALGVAADLPAGEHLATRPNIVFILADDLGYGDVQCLNPQRGKISTPHVDRLASQGMIFTDAHSGSSVCTPTRYGLLTGRYAWRSRLQAGVLDGSNDPPLITAERLTVPGLLRRHGYHTAALGKWHLGYLFAGPEAEKRQGKAGKTLAPVGTHVVDGPITRGFDYFYGFSNARTMKMLIENDRLVEHIDEIEMLPRLARRATTYIADRAADAGRGKPFFLYLALNSPHTPIVPSAQWQRRSGLNPYADFVMQTDAVVSEVLEALDKHGLAHDTLVLFTSDNGCSPAARIDDLQRAGHFPSADLHGHKADIWDGGHRVPFIVRWPGRVKAGTRSEQLVCLTDLMATCAELLGERLPATAGEDSVSILPPLLGVAKGPLREAVVHHSINGKFSIRQGPWKLELCAGSGGWSDPKDAAAAGRGLPDIQLYNMAQDLGEEKNVQAEHPEVVQRLTKLLEKYVAEGRSTPGPSQPNDAPVDLWKKGKGAKKSATRNRS